MGVVPIWCDMQLVGLFPALYSSPPGRLVHSDFYLTSLGNILATQQLSAKTIHSHISTTGRYSFIQPSELTRREKNENVQASKR